MSNDQQLPSPEEDITKTSHFRTFTPGSGGPHLDVLLHNQRTIMKQNQDIRRLVEHLLRGQRKAKGLGSAGKKGPLVEVDVDESIRQAILEASYRYNEKFKDMKVPPPCKKKPECPTYLNVACSKQDDCQIRGQLGCSTRRRRRVGCRRQGGTTRDERGHEGAIFPLLKPRVGILIARTDIPTHTMRGEDSG